MTATTTKQNLVSPKNRFRRIPWGEYDARIINSRNTPAHSGAIVFEIEIIGGAYDGHIVTDELPINHQSPKEKGRARAKLENLCYAVGVHAPQDSRELHNIPLRIILGTHKNRNTVLRYQAAPKAESQGTSSPQSRPGLDVVRADQLELCSPEWLLTGILERDTFAMLFGDPSNGKTFLALDWACRIATGTPWRNHPVEPAPVLYIAGEGRNGLARRIKAWQLHNGASIEGAPLFIAPALAISDANQLETILQGVEAKAPQPALVVVDTLARCFGEGDENSTKDMNRFVSACDTIRNRWRCGVLVVHHTGHGDKSRARGAIALKAALDAEYRLEISEGNNLLLTATKMKEAELPSPLAMKLESVDLPSITDTYGNPITSAAIEILDADVAEIVAQGAKAQRQARRGKWQKMGLAAAKRLAAMSECGTVDIKAWHDECEKDGMSRPTRFRVLSEMKDAGEIIVSASGSGFEIA
jgi:hypothetical protein